MVYKPIIGEFVTIDLKHIIRTAIEIMSKANVPFVINRVTDEYQVDVYGNKFCTSHSILIMRQLRKD